MLLNWYFSMKKNEKNSADFWKFTFESQKLALLINLITHHFCQFTEYNNFLWGYWFLAKNLTNFVFLPWKLDNPYYHSALTTEWTDSFLHSEDIKLHVGFVIGLLNDHLIFYFYFYFYFLSKDSLALMKLGWNFYRSNWYVLIKS